MSRLQAPAQNSLTMALPSPVPSPRAAKTILVHKARGEGQGEGTCSILCNVRANSFDDTRRPHQFAFDFVEDAVDELAAVLGGEFFGDIDGLVDADHRRD